MSKKKKFHQVHNDFLLDLLETEDDYLGALALALPEKEFAEVRDGKLSPLPTVYTDFEMVERRMDCLLLAEQNKKDSSKKLFPLEFKTDQLPRLFGQLLLYQTILFREYCLPITTIVIYSGKRKSWTLPLSLVDHLRSLGFHNIHQKTHLNFAYRLVNLHDYSIGELMQKAQSIGAGLYILSRIHSLEDKDVVEFYLWSEKMPSHARKRVREKTIVFIMKYGNYTWERLEKLAAECLPNGGRTVRRIRFSREGAVAEAREEGKAEGKAEGKVEGKVEGKAEGKADERRDIALNMLKEGAPEAFICRTTKLSRKEVQLLKRSL